MKNQKRGIEVAVVFLIAVMLSVIGGTLYAWFCCTQSGCGIECCVSESCQSGGCASGSQFGRCWCDGQQETIDCRPI